MAIDFPSSPSVGQQYSFGGTTYTFTAQGVWSPIGAVAGVSPPQGRLTLQTAVPVMTTTQSAKTQLYYTPYVGNIIPIYNGSAFVMTAFPEISVLTTDTTKNPAAIGASKVNDWFVWNDAGTLRVGHGPDWTSDTVRSAGTALVMVNGILLNNASITNGPAAQRGTYVGTTRSNASSQLNWIPGGAATGGVATILGVWNCYNRVSVGVKNNDDGATYTYASATVRQMRASANNQISWIYGLAEDDVLITYMGQFTTPAAAGAAAGQGIAYDVTNAYAIRSYWGNSGGASGYYSPSASLMIPNPFGYHFAAAVEAGDGVNTCTHGSNLTGTFLNAKLRM